MPRCRSRRLVQRCQNRPVAHVAAEMGISRQCASRWVNRYRRFGEVGLLNRSSVPHRQPTATPPEVVGRIEQLRRARKWSARRIIFELHAQGVAFAVPTVSRHLIHVGLNQCRYLDLSGENNRAPRPIVARWPGHVIHLDVKKIGRIPEDPRLARHRRGSDHHRTTRRTKTAGPRTAYAYLHSAVDGISRLAYTEALPDEKATTAIGFTHRAWAFFARHGTIHVHRIVTDNGKVERYNRILAKNSSTPESGPANTNDHRP